MVQDRPVLNPTGKATAVHLLYTRSSRRERGSHGPPDLGGHWQPLLTWDPAAKHDEQPIPCPLVTPGEPVDDDEEEPVEFSDPHPPAISPEPPIDRDHPVATVATPSRSAKSSIDLTQTSDRDDGTDSGDGQCSSDTDDDQPASTAPTASPARSSREGELFGQPLAGVFLDWVRASFDVMTSLGAATRVVRVGDRVRCDNNSTRPIKKVKTQQRDDMLLSDDRIIVAITSYDDGGVAKRDKEGPGCVWVVAHARLSSDRPVPTSVSKLGAIVSRAEPTTTAAAFIRQLKVAITNWKRAVIANPVKFLADARAVDSVCTPLLCIAFTLLILHITPAPLFFLTYTPGVLVGRGIRR